MNSTKTTWVAVLALVISIIAAFLVLNAKKVDAPDNSGLVGGAGNMLAEEYMPYIRYNNGYRSALPIQTSSTTDIAATTTITSSYFSVGSMDYAYVQVSMAATSSIPCTIPYPWGPTDTTAFIQYFIASSTVGVTGANTLDLSTTSASMYYGSSTPALVYGHAIATAATDYLLWTPIVATSSVTTASVLSGTYPDGRAVPLTLKANEALTYRYATSSPGTFTNNMAGTCSALIMKP